MALAHQGRQLRRRTYLYIATSSSRARLPTCGLRTSQASRVGKNGCRRVRVLTTSSSTPSSREAAAPPFRRGVSKSLRAAAPPVRGGVPSPTADRKAVAADAPRVVAASRLHPTARTRGRPIRQLSTGPLARWRGMGFRPSVPSSASRKRLIAGLRGAGGVSDSPNTSAF
jgi:hypothetical protein